MFELLRNQSRSSAGAIKYVTVGVLMMIWAGLWYYYFIMPQSDPPAGQKFACVGFILSGSAIGAIGLLFGLIGRGAKGADTTVGVASTEPVASIVPVATTANINTSRVVGDTPVVSAIPTTATSVRSVTRT